MWESRSLRAEIESEFEMLSVPRYEGFTVINPEAKAASNSLNCKKYHEKRKNDAEYLERKRRNARAYREKNLELVREKQREAYRLKYVKTSTFSSGDGKSNRGSGS